MLWDFIPDPYKRSRCAEGLIDILDNIEAWQEFIKKMAKISEENDI